MQQLQSPVTNYQVKGIRPQRLCKETSLNTSWKGVTCPKLSFRKSLQFKIHFWCIIHLVKWKCWWYWKEVKQFRALSLPVKTTQMHCSIGLLTAQQWLWKVTQRWRFCLFYDVIRTKISQMQDICDLGIVPSTCIHPKAIVNIMKLHRSKLLWYVKANNLRRRVHCHHPLVWRLLH